MSLFNRFLDKAGWIVGQGATGGLGRPSDQQRQNIQQAQQIYDNAMPTQKMEFESDLWKCAIERPGTALKSEILTRVFSVIQAGGLVFRTRRNNAGAWKSWASTGWPIGSALSHGARVMIQLPLVDPRTSLQEDHSFFNWIMAKDQLGDQSRFGSIVKQRAGTHSTGNRIDEWTPILNGRVKVLKELKGAMFGAGQSIGTSVGQSYGINIALGGANSASYYGGQRISDNGCFGHLYVFYRPPTREKFGGMLIGCEGEEDGKWGVSGNFHSWNLGPLDKARKYRASDREAFFGPKWKDNTFQLPDTSNAGALINGPDNYDSMVIDLTSGWSFLEDVANWFEPDEVLDPAEEPRDIAPVNIQLPPIVRGKLSHSTVTKFSQVPNEALGLKLYYLSTFHQQLAQQHVIAHQSYAQVRYTYDTPECRALKPLMSQLAHAIYDG